MNTQRCFAFLLLATVSLAGAEQVSVPAQANLTGRLKYNSAAFPKRLKRAEAFLGMHMDFHAGPDCKEIGKRTTREMIESLLDRVKPDYVQIDCKGHAGYCSYPTKVGNPAPGFAQDQLRLWRQVTAERGVALYMHYSGVWDSRAVELHPDWARMNEKGERDWRLTSVFGPYAGELLIPQMKELAGGYGVDGIWIDGECWAVERDWSDRALQLFREKTGRDQVPRKPGDPHWAEFTEFCRDGFRNYVRHYVNTLHEFDPEFEIASNWAFTSKMPEPVSANVDFLSGDFTPGNAVWRARMEGRSLQHQGKPWDLMAWGFSWGEGRHNTKTALQLQQEAAVVLALGGGYQVYFNQLRDGSVRSFQVDVMSEVAKFCRARQPFCQGAKPVPQIGVVFSTFGYYRRIPGMFESGTDRDAMTGILNSLLDAQNVVDLVMEHQLKGRMQDYAVLIYPEWGSMDPSFKKELLDYVRQGGQLLVIGPANLALFAADLGVESDDLTTERTVWIESNHSLAEIRSPCPRVVLGSHARPFGQLHRQFNIEPDAEPAAVIAQVGRGQIAATRVNLGVEYTKHATPVLRDFLHALVRELNPDPVVKVTGSHQVDVTLNQKNGRWLVNLVNEAGHHPVDSVDVFDEIPAIGPLQLSVKCPAKPKSVRSQPEGNKLTYRWRNGRVELTVPRVAVHEIVEIALPPL